MTRHRAALRARIQRRFATVTEPVAFGPIRFDFTRVADPNRVLDEVAAEEDRREKSTGHRHQEPLHLPYWAELWDSGGGVCQFLVDRVGSMLGQSVMDLGCGQGLVGTTVSRLGGRVLFGDLEAPAVLFARLNSWPAKVRARRVDWQKDRLGERFDRIVGADILYDRTQWQYLDPFWRAHLKPGGTVLLGEPGRPTGGMFLDFIAKAGWTVNEHEQAVATRSRPIRIFEMSLLPECP